MTDFNAKGEVLKIYPLQQVSERFQKREFVIRVDDGSPYPPEILCALTQNKCDLIDGIREGEMVEIRASVKGRKWQRTPADEPKWFNSIEVFQLKRASASFTPDADLPPPDFIPEETSGSYDDLPF
jgi:hypothetical protein